MSHWVHRSLDEWFIIRPYRQNFSSTACMHHAWPTPLRPEYCYQRLFCHYILFYFICFEFLNNERNSPYYLGSLWTEVDMPLGVCLDSGNVQCFLWVSYCLWNSQVLFFSKTTLKLGFTVLFTHLKIVN